MTRSYVRGTRKLTEEQRASLLAVYVEQGFSAAQPLAKELGVGPKYATKMALVLGLRPRIRRASKDVQRAARRNTDGDPRWAWAIARGEVRI